MKLRGQVVIRRPAAAVFAFVADRGNYPRWNPRVAAVRQVTGGPVGPGTTYKETAAILGRRLTATVEVTEYAPGVSLALRGRGGALPFAQRYTFEPVPEGTRFAYEAEVRPRGALRLAEALLARAAQRETESMLRRLKAILEREG